MLFVCKDSNSVVILPVQRLVLQPMEKHLYIEGVGPVRLRTHPRATRYRVKIAKGEITAVMPEGGDEKRMVAFIRQSRKELLEALERNPPRQRLDESTSLWTATFQLHIFRTDRQRFYMNLQGGILHLACPATTDFEDETVQSTLRKMIEKALRYEAVRLLPARLEELARQHGFTYECVKINNSQTHWGSCTSRKRINLSLSLMLLPWHLIDYVLLHELCHTVELNHSPRFWLLMDRVTGGRAEAWRKELKSHTVW